MKCNFCDKEIEWPLPYAKGSLPINSDGTEHRCKSKPADPPRQEPKQESLAGLEDLEKAELQSKDPITDKHITDQMALIGKIEKRVKADFLVKYGSNYSVQQLGLWVKLIYHYSSFHEFF